jgi:hypothetical protein
LHGEKRKLAFRRTCPKIDELIIVLAAGDQDQRCWLCDGGGTSSSRILLEFEEQQDNNQFLLKRIKRRLFPGY